MRGRKPGFAMSDEHRVKIQNSNILNALVEHVEGKREMSATQVSAGIALLRKVLPDMTAIEHSGEIVTSKVIRAPALATTAQTWAEQHVPEQHRTEH